MAHGNYATPATSRTVQRNQNASHEQPVDASFSSTLIPEDSQINNNTSTYYFHTSLYESLPLHYFCGLFFSHQLTSFSSY